MTLNIEALSGLVTWAAEDHVRGTDPERAVALGLAKEGDPRLGKWDQESWGVAKRNGVCQTAFCIAGGAVALDDEWITLMEPGERDWETKKVLNYVGNHAMKVSDLPKGTEIKWNYAWLDKEVWEAFDSEEPNYPAPVSYAGRTILGLDGEQADRLFNGGNSIQQVVTLAVDFAKEEGLTLNLPEWVVDEFYGKSDDD